MPVNRSPSMIARIARAQRLTVWVWVLAILASSSLAKATQTLKVSSNGRYLQQADGTPFFWLGDTNWRLYKLDDQEIATYLNNRRSREFNVIQGPVLLSGSENSETGTPDGASNSDPANPNEQF